MSEESAARRGPRHPRPRPRAGLIGAGLLAGAAAVAAIAVVRSDDRTLRTIDTSDVPVPSAEPDSAASQSSEPTRSSESTTVVTLPPDPPPSVPMESIPPVPLSRRSSAAVAGSPAGLFVWGGTVPNEDDWEEPPLFDGAWYDIAAKQWRPIAAEPSGNEMTQAVFAADRFVVAGAGGVATYRPELDSWGALDVPPGWTSMHRLIAVGDRVVALPAGAAPESAAATVESSGSSAAIGLIPGGAILEPSGAWTPLDVPEDLRLPVGESYVAFAGSATDVFAVVAVGSAWRIHRFDLAAGNWSQIDAPARSSIDARFGAVVAGERLIVAFDLTMEAQALERSTGEWSNLALLPDYGGKCGMGGIALGDRVLVDACGAALLERGGGWRSVAGTLDAESAYILPGLVALGPQAALVNGLIVRTDPGGQIVSPLGSVRLAGLRIGSDARPGVATRTGRTLVLELGGAAAGCRVEAVQRSDAWRAVDDGGQRTLAQALSGGGSDLEFWNRYGSRYRLSCPSAEAVQAAVASILVEGELVAPTDVSDRFSGTVDLRTGGWADGERIANEFGASLEPPMKLTGVGFQPPSAEPGMVAFDYAPIDPHASIGGAAVEIELLPGDDPITVGRATLWFRCRDAAHLTEADRCRGDEAPLPTP